MDTPDPDKKTEPPAEPAKPPPAPVEPRDDGNPDDDAPAVTMADLAEVNRQVQETEARIVAQLGRLVPPAKPAEPAPAAAPKKKGGGFGVILALLALVGLLVAAALTQRPPEPKP